MFRVGIGYDIHSTIEGDSIFLGAVQIPTDFSLRGHSDADVLLHAITDAILGAVGAKDIGHHFSNTDKTNRNEESQVFLKKADEIMKSEGYSLVNVDMNVICERPKLAPYREIIEKKIADMLDISEEQINLKAKTNEELDALGKGQGIAAQVVVLLSRDKQLF